MSPPTIGRCCRWRPSAAAAGGGGTAVRAPAPHPDPAATVLRAPRAGSPRPRRGSRRSAGNAGRAAPGPQDRTGLQAHPAPPGPRPRSGGGGAGGLARAGRGPAMTLDHDATTVPTAEQERPADPRPAWERVAYTWLDREVDADRPVDPTALAAEVSVAPGFARDLVRVLRAGRDRDPALGELRARVVRDRITDAYLARELSGGQPLDPTELAAEVGTSPTVARQWLHSLRAGRESDRRLASLRAEPLSHGRPTDQQLVALQAAYADGGRPQLEDRRPADRALERIEQLYQAREIARGQSLDAAEV